MLDFVFLHLRWETMCPPAPSSPISIVVLTDVELILLLEYIIHGYPSYPLPNNVIADLNPFNYLPSNLPDGLVYFLRSEVKKDTKLGSWKAKGEQCEIFTNSVITGWRTTLEFHEGQAPNDQKTDWVMQEYRITQKGLCNNRNTKDSGSRLYRLLNSEECIPDHVVHPKNGGSLPTDSTTRQGSTSEAQKKNGEVEIRSLTAAERLSCVLQGDFLELDDLVDLQSPSSSSDNSSCPSFASDELFDSLALLRDLEDKNIEQQAKDASFKCAVSTSVIPNEVVIRPATLGTLSAEDIQKFDYSLSIEDTIDERVLKCKRANETASSSQNAAASSSHNKAVKEKKKKDVVSRMKKLKKKYFCLMPF